MNSIGPNVLTDVGKAAIKARISAAIKKNQIGITVVVKTPTGVSTNYASGAVTVSASSTSVTALPESITSNEIANSGGLFQQGDKRIRVFVDDLSTAPTTSSSFTIGSDNYAVIAVSKDNLDLHYLISGRINP